MKFHVTMLCGGKSMMLTPSESVTVNLKEAEKKVSDVVKCSSEMLEFMYHDIKITLYTSGNVFFYHFIDRPKAFEYAEEILRSVT